MADLNNLLAELDGAQDENILLQPPVEREEEIDRDYEGVPEVLKAAQERKHQDDDQDIDGVGQFDEDLGTTLNMAQDEDYARLKTAWIKELLCPELLPYDHDTISLEQELIEGQEETIDALTSTKNVDALVAHIYRLDVERTKFIMSDLLVTRLDKLEAHALHNRTVLDRMSDREVSFLCPIVLVSTWESLILCSCGIFPLSFSLVAHFRFRI
jgi:GINS complex subunit 4